MKIKTWTIWILLLLLPGSIGWLSVSTQRNILDQQISSSRQVYKKQSEEYLNMYENWARLSSEQKLDNPWGQDPYGGPQIQRKLQENQDQRLLASLPELLSGTDIPDQVAEILFGYSWQQTVNDYRRRLEVQEIIAITSTLLLVTSALLTAVFLVRGAIILARRPKSRRPAETQTPAPAPVRAKEPPALLQRPSAKTLDETDTGQDSEPESPLEESDTPTVAQTLGYFETVRQKNVAPARNGSDSGCDDKRSSAVSRASMALLEEPPAAADPALERLMTPEPVVKELNELTEQMSAIRQFAADQQTHIRKLQDGYDWLIIKRFCLRIIRCVDNLEDRIQAFESKSKDTSVFQDIRDELLFALESSGVETFEPDLGREYRGLEKYAEAVKDRKENDSPERSGTIAEIVRPGYHYLISEEDVKIVRCAQVRLYS